MSETINTPFQIDKTKIEEYQVNGHVRIDHLCPAEELAIYRPVINQVVSVRKRTMALQPMEERDTYGKAFLQLMNLWVDNSEVAKFVLAKRFASVAAQLLGVEKVRVYHDQALYKEAHSGFTPMHQDQHYWPLDTDKCVTMWMPLMDICKTMGTLNFATGSGNAGYLGDMPISDDSEAQLAKLCAQRGYQIVNHGGMQAGDATFHSGWCLHGAPGNTTDTLREVMTIIWFADDTRIIKDPDPLNRWNKNKWDDMDRWLPDRKPGQLADGKLTPLVVPFM